jgi:uncharacterized protein (TIGR02186 family)
MSRIVAIAVMLALIVAATCRAATAQEANPQQATPQVALPQETIQIGLSTDMIAITSNFTGTALTIFGALTNVDPLIQRQGRYDLVVVLEGPEVPLVLRRKSRVFGMWLNTASEPFELVPLSYIASSTRKMQDITDRQTFAQMSIGVDSLNLHAGRPKNTRAIEFSNALKELNKETGLYVQDSGTVEFISPNLFRATLQLPANIPVGKHKARAFLFRNGTFVRESSSNLQIEKAGIEQTIYIAAYQNSVWYGLGSIALAMTIGWLGNAVFRKG